MTDLERVSEQVRDLIRDVPDFPKPGIIFKDLAPVFASGETFRLMTEAFAARYADRSIDAFVCIESRGFIVGCPLAVQLKTPAILVRKKGKLPGEVVSQTYDLEYGQDTLEVQQDALRPGMRVVIMDDLLATGGTMEATIDLVKSQGAEIVEVAFVVELSFLKGRERLSDVACHALLTY